MARAEPRVSQEGNANRLGKDGYANGFFSTKSDRTIRKPCNAIGVQNLVAGVNERYGELRQQRQVSVAPSFRVCCRTPVGSSMNPRSSRFAGRAVPRLPSKYTGSLGTC